ncbi:hypothetical protein, partial [Allisonella histaminiformans]|uniref:hypothetical protein n=1 Tax=Allisonella histaminiformans TaxID=209880 RepID=UPI002E77CE36
CLFGSIISCLLLFKLRDNFLSAHRLYCSLYCSVFKEPIALSDFIILSQRRDNVKRFFCDVFRKTVEPLSESGRLISGEYDNITKAHAMQAILESLISKKGGYQIMPA